MAGRNKVSKGDTVAYVAADGTAGLGEVIDAHGDLLDLRAVNVAGAPVVYQVPHDNAGSWNSWKPLAGNEGGGD